MQQNHFLSNDPVKAFAFHPSLQGKTAVGNLRFDYDRIRFTSDLGNVEMILSDVRMEFGGHNSEQLFFTHPSAQGWSVYTKDAAVLSHYQKKRKTNHSVAIFVLATLGLFIGALLLVFSQREKIVRFIADKLPIEWENKFGDSAFEQVRAQGKLVTDLDARSMSYLGAVTNALLPVIKDTGYQFKFYVMNDTNINAFAMPGGHVVIFTGLLDSAGTPEELAGVLAHEIAHVTQRHSLRLMIQSAGLLVAVQSLFGDTSGLLAVLGEGARVLIGQKYSRDFEREADDVGWNYLLAAEIDPRGMTKFFEKLKAAEKSGAGSMPSALQMLSTHPATDERIANLDAKWNALTKRDFKPLQPVISR